MSTKCTIAYSNKPESDFHFYHECLEEDGSVYLELRGEVAQFEAAPGRVVVRIPAEIWQVIRQHEAIVSV